MKRAILLLVTLLPISFQANAQTLEKIKYRLGFSKPAIPKNARASLESGDLEKALIEYSEAVALAQDIRTETHGVDGELMAEYAYTLALHHDLEAALMYIDRARLVKAKHGDFYASEILTIAGYSEAARQLMAQAETPSWIEDFHQSLTQSHTYFILLNLDAPQDALKRANQLAANGQTIQAIVLFEELLKLHPNAYILYVDYSTIWENMGNKDHAASLLNKGINLMPKSLTESESHKSFVNHLTTLNGAKTLQKNKNWIRKILGDAPPRLMSYIGASATPKSLFFNGRMGLYSSNRFSTSINLGLGITNKNLTGSIGISAYKYWGVFFAGLGITDRFTKGSNTFGFSPTVGLSFLNKSQTSSLDFSLSCFVPLFSDSQFSYSISIGKTLYIDWKGFKK